MTNWQHTLRQTFTFFFMKTSTTLTILGVYQTLSLGCMAMLIRVLSMGEMASFRLVFKRTTATTTV